MITYNNLNKIVNKESISYIFFGVLTTIVNYIVYFVCTVRLNINYMIANIIAWIISVSFAYITNKLYVFKSRDTYFYDLIREFTYFTLARFTSLLFEMIILFVFVDILDFVDSLIKITAGIVVIILNYYFSKLIIFKR